MKKIAMLGSGFIGDFYVKSLHGQRRPDRVVIAYSRSEQNVSKFAQRYGIPKWTTNMDEAINDPEVEVVCVALPNNLHKEAVLAAAAAGKAVICTKPLGRNAEEAREMLDAVEKAGVFHGYLEDLVYTPKTLKAVQTVKQGALGKILWTRSREAHPGPHSDWFWSLEQAGGGALLDLGCHCIEIGRSYVGKNNRPVEVMCWADTQVKPIEAEDHAIGLVKYESGAIGQFEVSWCFRGGLDLRDEVAGTEGTIWINHFMRTGFEVFTSGNQGGYVSEKSESESGWTFPVGDEDHELGYNHMFTEMLNCLENGTQPTETFYDGYVVNAVMDACLLSSKTKKWEPVKLDVWRGGEFKVQSTTVEYDENHWLIKEERLSNGTVKRILKDKKSGQIIQRVQEAQV